MQWRQFARARLAGGRPVEFHLEVTCHRIICRPIRPRRAWRWHAVAAQLADNLLPLLRAGLNMRDRRGIDDQPRDVNLSAVTGCAILGEGRAGLLRSPRLRWRAGKWRR